MPFTLPPPPLNDPTYLRHRRWMIRALASDVCTFFNCDWSVVTLW